MSCGITRGRQEAIDEVRAILLNELAVDFGGSDRQMGMVERLDFHRLSAANLTASEDRAGGELNTAFKPFARSASRGSQMHQNFLPVIRRLN